MMSGARKVTIRKKELEKKICEIKSRIKDESWREQWNKNWFNRITDGLNKYLKSKEAEYIKTILELTNSDIYIFSESNSDTKRHVDLTIRKDLTFQSYTVFEGDFDPETKSLTIEETAKLIGEFCPEWESHNVTNKIHGEALKK
jgi:hypothetical protein